MAKKAPSRTMWTGEKENERSMWPEKHAREREREKEMRDVMERTDEKEDDEEARNSGHLTVSEAVSPAKFALDG